MFKEYKASVVVARRLYAVFLGILLFPLVALLPAQKRALYSYLHAVWMKQGTKPVWLSETEKAGSPLIDF